MENMTEGPGYQGQHGLKGSINKSKHGLHGHRQGRGVQLAPDTHAWQVQGQVFFIIKFYIYCSRMI